MTTSNFKITMEYDGTHFHGWQKQVRLRTVQGEIEHALKKTFKEKIVIHGSGRTDSKVHALGQVANFHTATSMNSHQIQKALNSHLPQDINILKAQKIHPKFHAQYSVKRKTYRYLILNRPTQHPLYRHYALWFRHNLDTALMKKEAKDLIGRHDFKSFQAADPAKRGLPAENTIRTIYNISFNQESDFITIDIQSNGFLYKMVRNIVGTLLNIGNGTLPQHSLKNILIKKNRDYAGVTAKPHGLYLLHVKYS